MQLVNYKVENNELSFLKNRYKIFYVICYISIHLRTNCGCVMHIHCHPMVQTVGSKCSKKTHISKLLL